MGGGAGAAQQQRAARVVRRRVPQLPAEWAGAADEGGV
jgi:hypothetical protein